ncbi:MAG: serine/threonine-protein kinase [Planctomycetota bacterium]
MLSLHVGAGAPERSVAPSAPAPSAAAAGSGRVAFGTLIDERYRVLERIGAGGMGEVVRAEDLRLEQVVALKFLPEHAVQDAGLRARLLEEVRMARQVTHPGVCRVHDVGEFDGQLYLSMELIDGEDLHALLRRIGRLPEDKALEIARQLCAGLGAAHARGILHRDLKPANVMLDGRGRARITDFGLAVAGNAGPGEAFAGTPSYMAPEQLAGEEATVQSDVYALGLVLYELFTGTRPHAGTTPDELLRERRSPEVAPPSTTVRGLDPKVERVVLQCLDPNPAARPASALTVAAALPGGGSLEEALASGETPSPELVAAAGGVGALSPRAAGLCAAAVVVLAFVIAAMNRGSLLIALEQPELPPEVLVHRASELLRGFGYDEEPRDSAFGAGRNGSLLRHIARTDDSADRWKRLAELDLPSSFLFWYRESPHPLDPTALAGRVWLADPEHTVPGMASVILSPGGKLFSLRAQPPADFDHERAADAPGVAWDELLAAAGLDPSLLEPLEPSRTPPMAYDEILSWKGVHPEAPEIPLEVDAAGFEGRPVHFQLHWEWAEPSAAEQESLAARLLRELMGLVELTVVVGGAWLGFRSLRTGRGDRRGAFRVAAFFFGLQMLAWACRVHPVANVGYFFRNLFDGVGGAARQALAAWVVYMALEPFVRRTWPNCLVAWTRLLSGGFRDPMVGREVLLGVLVAEAAVLIQRMAAAAAPALGLPPPIPPASNFDSALGLRLLLSDHLSGVTTGLIAAFGAVFVLVIFRFVLRHRVAAVLAFLGLALVSAPAAETGSPWLDYGQQAIFAGILAWVMARHGLLLIAVGIAWLVACENPPVTLELTTWYGHAGVVHLLLAAALAYYGYRTASPAWTRSVQAARSGA